MIVSAAADIGVEQGEFGVRAAPGLGEQLVVEDGAEALAGQRADLDRTGAGGLGLVALDAAQSLQDARCRSGSPARDVAGWPGRLRSRPGCLGPMAPASRRKRASLQLA